MASRNIEPYRDPTMPERFMRWLEVLRARLAGIPCFFQGAGNPENVITANAGDRYYDELNFIEYIKSTNGGNTGWLSVGAGLAGLGLWRYRTAITPNPAAGRLQFDNGAIASATNLYVNVLNDGGTDMTSFLGLIVTGDVLYIQSRADATSFVVLQVGLPALAAGVYTFPITAITVQGTQFSQNDQVAVLRT